MFWTSIITKPKPNSTAESIKKKKVKESRLRLSKSKPVKSTKTYKVTHRNSAVKSKWRAVFTFNAILEISKVNKISIKLKSPNNIN